MPAPSKEADRILTIIQLAADRTRDRHKQMASFTSGEQWWDTFAREVGQLAGGWDQEKD